MADTQASPVSRFRLAANRLGVAFVVLFAIFICAGGYWFAFVPDSPPDIPTYPGAQNMRTRPNYTGSDAPYGAIVLVTFETHDKPDKVKQFYYQALLSRGWHQNYCDKEIFGHRGYRGTGNWEYELTLNAKSLKNDMTLFELRVVKAGDIDCAFL